MRRPGLQQSNQVHKQFWTGHIRLDIIRGVGIRAGCARRWIAHYPCRTGVRLRAGSCRRQPSRGSHHYTAQRVLFPALEPRRAYSARHRSRAGSTDTLTGSRTPDDGLCHRLSARQVSVHRCTKGAEKTPLRQLARRRPGPAGLAVTSVAGTRSSCSPLPWRVRLYVFRRRSVIWQRVNCAFNYAD